MQEARESIVAAALNKIRGLFPSMMNQANSFSHPGCCCLGLSEKEIALAIVRHRANAQIERLEIIPREKNRSLESQLAAAVKHFTLEDMPCYWILQPEEYQLFLFDALPVPAAEFQAAIRWKVASLLNFPIDEAIIDSFPVPQQKTHAPHDMIITAVTRLPILLPTIESIRASGMIPAFIGIQELALRNITALYETDEKGTALFWMREKDSEILLTCQKKLYFQRIVNLSALQCQADVDRVALEIQRSLDYYQAQWRKAPPGRLFLATTIADLSVSTMAAALTTRLATPVTTLHLHEQPIMHRLGKDVRIENCMPWLPIVGAAIRREAEDAAAD